MTSPNISDAIRLTHRSVADRWQRRAWVSLALVPVGFVASMILGELLIRAQGYELGTDVVPPLGAALLAGIPAILVGITPAIAGLWFGLQARRHGHRRGLVPAAIGATIAIGYVALNLQAAILGG